MPDTTLDLVKRVNAKVGLDPNITAFSYDDESQLVLDFINDAEAVLRDSVTDFTYLDKRATLTTVASQRLYTLPSDATALELYEWSFFDDTNNITLNKTDLRDIQENHADDFETKLGKPEFIYIDNGQVALYPVPDAAYDIDYSYRKELTRKTSTTATYDYPDDFLRFLEYKAIAEYQMYKGLGNPEYYLGQAQTKLANIIAKQLFDRKQFFL